MSLLEYFLASTCISVFHVFCTVEDVRLVNSWNSYTCRSSPTPTRQDFERQDPSNEDIKVIIFLDFSFVAAQLLPLRISNYS